MVGKDTTEQLLDDAGIIGGSPVDRIIGMLLERTEAIRELHESMRAEFRGLIETHAEIRNMMLRMADRQENHEKSDRESFASINLSNSTLGIKLDSLSGQIAVATTASVIQKAQFNAGWRVIVTIGGSAIALFSIFAIFFNHSWK